MLCILASPMMLGSFVLEYGVSLQLEGRRMLLNEVLFTAMFCLEKPPVGIESLISSMLLSWIDGVEMFKLHGKMAIRLGSWLSICYIEASLSFTPLVSVLFAGLFMLKIAPEANCFTIPTSPFKLRDEDIFRASLLRLASCGFYLRLINSFKEPQCVDSSSKVLHYSFPGNLIFIL